MTSDDYLLDRIRAVLREKHVLWSEKKMFGGNCFMVDDKMLIGTFKGGVMARVAPEETNQLTQRTGAEQMIHGGKPMTGYLYIQPEGYDMDSDLAFWVEKCLAYNPIAKSSTKKKK